MEVVSSSKRQKKCSEIEEIPESLNVASSSSTGCLKEEEEVEEVIPNPLLLLCPNFIQTELWPEKKDDMLPAASTPPKLAEDAYHAYSHRLPEYEYDYNNDHDIMINSNNIKTKSSPVDVISLLAGGSGKAAMMYRNDGCRELLKVDESTFRDKYILICCFHLPIFLAAPDTLFLQPLATTCFELYSTRRNDLEIVLVAKMDKFLNYELLFTHFLRGFPSPCFVVPFEDSKRRDYICYCLHLRGRLRMQGLLLDNKGKEERNVLFSGYPPFTDDYGADAFPYTDEILKELDAQDFPKWKTASTSRLDGLLGCTPSDVLRNTGPSRGREEITISELKEHVVVLYLCVKGNLMTAIQDLCQQCKAKDLSFEVVLVYLPFVDSRDPEIFTSNIDIMLKQNNLSCWGLPFKNSVSHRLNRLMDFPCQDKLIIVGPHDAYVEPYGGKDFRNLGVDAYPFFREEFVQRKLHKVKEHTLESLLVHGSWNYVLQGDNKLVVSELLGRHIVLYYGCLARRELFDEIFKWYYEIKANDPTFEVVYVHKNSTAVLEVDSDLLASMPWLVCPFDPVHSAFLDKEFFGDGIELRESLVEFGKNGRICSFRARNHLSFHGPEGFPFGDSNLRCDVIRYLRLNFKSMRCLD